MSNFKDDTAKFQLMTSNLKLEFLKIENTQPYLFPKEKQNKRQFA